MNNWILTGGATRIATFQGPNSGGMRPGDLAEVITKVIDDGGVIAPQWRITWSDVPGDEIFLGPQEPCWHFLINSELVMIGSLEAMLTVAMYHERTKASNASAVEYLAKCMKMAGLQKEGTLRKSYSDMSTIFLNELIIERRKAASAQEDSKILSHLMAAGIDNTSAYEEGMRAYHSGRPETDDVA